MWKKILNIFNNTETRQNNPENRLLEAIKNNDLILIESLMDRGFKIDKEQQLVYAAGQNKQSLMKLLISKGANVNDWGSDFLRMTPLNSTIINACWEINGLNSQVHNQEKINSWVKNWKMLLDAGADPTVPRPNEHRDTFLEFFRVATYVHDSFKQEYYKEYERDLKKTLILKGADQFKNNNIFDTVVLDNIIKHMDGYKNMIDIFKKLGLEVDYEVLKAIQYKAIKEYNIREEKRRQNESAIKEVQEKFQNRAKVSKIITKLVNDENGVRTDNGRERVLMKLFEEMGIFHLSSNSEVKKLVTPLINSYIKTINEQRQTSQLEQIALENLQNFEVNKARLIASDNRRTCSDNDEEIARTTERQVDLLTDALILTNEIARTNNIQRSKETQKQSTTPQTQDGINDYLEQHQYEREVPPVLWPKKQSLMKYHLHQSHHMNIKRPK